jgi:hypothetical protein
MRTELAAKKWRKNEKKGKNKLMQKLWPAEV